MVNISWLTRWLDTHRACRDTDKLLETEIKELNFERQELRKQLTEVKIAHHEALKNLVDYEKKLEGAYREIEDFQTSLAIAEETKTLAEAGLNNVIEQVQYLRGEIEKYQLRLGLLPQPRQAMTEAQTTPLRQARKPFSQLAHEVSQKRKEEYWKARAAEASEKLGQTGLTTDGNNDAPTA